MGNNCKNKNPLIRGGTSQEQRFREALQSSYVQIEEHDFADLLVFARRMAERIQYTALTDQADGSWSAFFADDVSLLIALIATNNLEDFREAFRERLDKLVYDADSELRGLYSEVDGDGKLTAAVRDDLPAYLPAFKQLFDLLLSLATHLDGQVNRLPEKSGLRAFALSSIRKECSSAFRNLLGYWKVGINAGSTEYILIDEAARSAQPPLPSVRLRYGQEVIAASLFPEWLASDKKWAEVLAIEINEADYRTAYGQTAPVIMEKPADVAAYLLPVIPQMEAVFDRLMSAYERIVNAAPEFLRETLEDWPAHQPHTALYLVFLRLLRFAYGHINGLKERHLDYYYEEVLRLRRQAARPDEARLILQLAKQVESLLLKAGTEFKAGKDSEGKEVVYKTEADATLNKAAVAQLKALYHTQTNGKTYVAPVANSEDGAGEALTNTDGSWPAFGPVQQFTGNMELEHPELPVPPVGDDALLELYNLVNQPAPVGFALASPHLLMQEGERTVRLRIRLERIDDGQPWPEQNAWTAGHFRLLFSGEEKWIEKTALEASLFRQGTETAVTPADTVADLLITGKLSEDDAPVIQLNPEIHGAHFDRLLPTVQILVVESGGTIPYNALANLQVIEVQAGVEVKGVKNLILQNDQSLLDPAKEFLPFGPMPRSGASFLVGSNEVFQKVYEDPADYLELKFDWEEPEKVNRLFPLDSDIEVLAFNLRQGTALSTQTLFSTSYNGSDIELNGPADLGITDYRDFNFSDNRPYRASDRYGYARLTLQQSLGHQVYQAMYPLALVQQSKETKDQHILDLLDENGFMTVPLSKEIAGNLLVLDDARLRTSGPEELVFGSYLSAELPKVIDIPDPPYTPKAKSMSLDYQATATFKVDGTGSIPFADRGTHFLHVYPFGQREEHLVLRPSGDLPPLLPPLPNEGELYIGIRDALPRQQVPVLFQVAEGSANPLKTKQEVRWSFLHENHWKDFDDLQEADVVDETNGLLQSGIIRFQLPGDISAENTWLPAGFRWLRAAVANDSDAVCRLITLQAQAIEVVFDNRGNAADFLAGPLPAGTISKLKQSDAAVKKIQQPYESVGGRLPETREQFYRRVSERLRHKDRAIAIWDYEHLVLQTFPEIYKVKCLNHTRVMTDPDNQNRLIDNEVAPGYVLVTTIPDLTGRKAVDPLRPYTSLATLESIREFLVARTSPHVTLDVRNPRYEQIRLDFEVRYRSGYDPTVYRKVLNQEIVQYLSPWAFESKREREIEFGGRIHKSVLIDFVEERSYVDFVVNFRLDQLTGPDLDDLLNVEEAVASTARSVLVSHPQHTIKEKTDDC